MAKTMAIIIDGIVTNMIWCNDAMQETETRKDPGDRPVGIGDTYSDGKWYRDGVENAEPAHGWENGSGNHRNPRKGNRRPASPGLRDREHPVHR